MRKLAGLVLVLTLGGLAAYAGDIQTIAHFGNSAFSWSATDPIAAPATFPINNWNYGATVSYLDGVNDSFTFEASYTTDPILRHLLSGIVSFQTGFLTIEGGPLLGILNSATVPVKGGMTVGLSLKIPGIFFAEFLSQASMGAGLYNAGDYIQEAGRLAAGFYVLNAICTASIYTRKFYLATGVDQLLVDSLIQYNLNLDIFKKGVTYRLMIDLGYDDLSRTYADGTIDRLGNVVIGAQVHISVTRWLLIHLGGRIAVMSFGQDALVARGPASNQFLFQSFAGVTIRTGAIEAAPTATLDPAATPTAEAEPAVFTIPPAATEPTPVPSAATEAGTESGSGE
ncbi:MAG: hypothetical protein A2087_11935 [Spirochaetes bacterium GWD1_61_31]|nr:MAG: hypothetical protein A2Y37_07055 [Spirochaetes bacterium GWB1_60_80]OHD30830.1 MAG: hypothetical protein A2004_04580 [Spirochaetes bacterium GWC1_61_12]OHD37381.1 MAG: hypothetical protein A2087_11935 [Spirochaetes bacterium GWD1_61_31]OHD46330.1 MAG: hypothetical protein A2Y35_07330 [Spirochaetes bacterium GWE1_60_18]OHD60937.1 MAG: hypothetical protein A2Y32_12075 [Spirochaetes bacterium GWF1_60_12]HAP42805.1 hypothetical protein [Spirochaetaceae bacterium]